MPLSDRFSDLEELISGAMGEALEDARRSLASEVRRRSTELARDARRRSLEDLQGSFRRLDSASDQKELLVALLEEAGRFSTRTALLITHQDRAQGWGAYGFPGTDQGMAEMEIGYEGAWGELARGTGCVHLPAEACASLCSRLGGDPPAEALVVPLVLRDRIAAALYADRVAEDDAFEPLALRLLVLGAAQALELQALRNRRATPTLYEAGERAEGLALWPSDGEVPSEAEVAEDERGDAGSAMEAAPAPLGDEPEIFQAPPPLEEPEPWQPAEEDAEPEPESAEATEEELEAEPEGQPVPEEVTGAPEQEPSAGPWEAPEESWPGIEPSEEGADRAGFELQPPPELESEVPAAAQGWETDERPADEGEMEPSEEAAAEPEGQVSEPGEDAVPGMEEELEPTASMPRADTHSEATVRFSVEALRAQMPPATEEEAAGLPPAGAEAEAGHEETAEPQPPPQAPPYREPASPPSGAGSTEVAPPPDLEGPGWAFRDQGAPGEAETARDPEQAALHEEARRLARLLVSEIKLYNEEQVEEGRRNRDLYSRLQEDIDRSRQMYEERVDPTVRHEADYFQQEMVNILAGGDAGALGI